MNSKTPFFVLVVLPALVLAARLKAETPPVRVAVINLQVVYSNLKETIDTQHQVDDLQKQLDQFNSSAKSPATKQSIDDHDLKQLDDERQRQSMKVRMLRLKMAQLMRANEEIKSALGDLVKSRGIDLVLADNASAATLGVRDMTDQQRAAGLLFNRSVLYSADQVDITPVVIGLINQNYRSPVGLSHITPEATTPIRIGSKLYQVEIAADDATRQRGLMERDALPADHGMIFVFPAARVQDFWMHHTRFDLDIIFADEHGRVVSIQTMKAYDEGDTSSDLPARYAIELNAGEAGRAGVKVGDKITIPTVVDGSIK